jgi:hypothetical protein
MQRILAPVIVCWKSDGSHASTCTRGVPATRAIVLERRQSVRRGGRRCSESRGTGRGSPTRIDLVGSFLREFFRLEQAVERFIADSAGLLAIRILSFVGTHLAYGEIARDVVRLGSLQVLE